MHGLDGVDRVHRRDHQVTCLGCNESGFEGLWLAQLTDVDDIGILPEDRTHALRKRLRVDANLALADDRTLVLVKDLDRILEGDDVGPATGVDVVNHGRRRRGLARPCRTGDQNQPILLVADLSDDFRESKRRKVL